MVALSGASVKTVAAQAEEDLRCQVPFSFTVNRATLPPGTYGVTVDDATGLVELRDMTHGVFAIGIPFDARRALDAKLVFHRYGDEYVLREVWTGTGTGRELPERPRERELSSAAGQGTHSARFERIELPLL
jgi:hypothetical protein